MPARSTTVVFPPSDFRYLFLRATGISRINGATVAAAPEQAQRIARPGTLRRTSRRTRRDSCSISGTATSRSTGCSSLAATPRYDRDATVAGSNDGRNWVDLARTRVFKLTRVGVVADRVERATPVPARDDLQRRRRAAARGPLARVRRFACAPRRGRPSGSAAPALRRPEGVAAELRLRAPAGGGARPRARSSRPARRRGREPGFEPRADTRSFTAKHPAVVTAALVLAAAVVAIGGFLALRQRA